LRSRSLLRGSPACPALSILFSFQPLENRLLLATDFNPGADTLSVDFAGAAPLVQSIAPQLLKLDMAAAQA